MMSAEADQSISLLVDGGKWYLSFGSFWSGIKLMSLNPSTGLPSSTALTSIAKRTANSKLEVSILVQVLNLRAGGAVEASSIYKNGSYYYLFTSWDTCCAGMSFASSAD